MKKRRTFTPEQKVSIIKRHLLESTPISDLCDEFKIHPNQYNEWQRVFFENGESAFSKDQKKERQKIDKKINDLTETIAHKDNVIAEIVSENLTLKKRNGGC